jgi:hypothetical protein
VDHPAIKNPPWVMVPVGSIDAPDYPIDYSQESANSASPESPKDDISRCSSEIQLNVKDCRDSGHVTSHFTRNVAAPIEEKTIKDDRPEQKMDHSSIFE